MSLEGKILIAKPSLTDPIFHHSIILVIKHSDEGATGLVLNKTSNILIKDAWKGLTDTNTDELKEMLKDNSEFTHVGGPCYGPMMCLHVNADASEHNVVPGLHWCSDMPNIVKVIREESVFRLYNGYSGWMAGQLETEVEHGHWVVGSRHAPLAYTFFAQEDSDKSWKMALDRIGKDLFRDIGIPEDFLNAKGNN